MSFDAKAVANFFLDLAEERGVPLTPMKLQKLVYYAHGWHLGLTGEPLIQEDVEAWPYGPVVTSLYHEFKHHGNNPIDTRATVTEWPTGSRSFNLREVAAALPDDQNTDYARRLLARVWDAYGQWTAVQLSNATHESGTPWDQVWQRYKSIGVIPRHTKIPNESIRSAFEAEAAEGGVTR